MEEYPLVSICMPAYNAGKYLVDSINSILKQTYTNWELIIVNDGSTDDTVRVLTAINDSRIKVHHQENKGQCAAANKAFALSTGELIKFMDADDLISENFIGNQVNRLRGHENAIAYASWGRFYNDDITTFKRTDTSLEKDDTPFNWLTTSMADVKQVMLQCALWLIPRDTLMRSGLWNEELSLINDFEFFIRVLLCADQLLFTHNAILYYRSGDTNSLSALKSRKGAESAYNSIEMGTGYLLAHEDSDKIKRIVAGCFQDFIYSFYPFHEDLIKKAEKKINELGGSGNVFPAGGLTYILQLLMGWKLTKRFKLFIAKKK